MIDGLREYVIHISATAMLCAVILRLARGSGAVKMMIKLLCGIVLAYSIVQPLKQLDFSVVERFTVNLQEDADRAVLWGQNLSASALSESISRGAETYIVEKAKAMDVELVVEVEVSDDAIPVPAAVSITGDVSPYAKSVLIDTISQDLNIPKEKQIWTSH
jgi:hypothetical protein